MMDQNKKRLKVVISVHGRWHAFDLANGLHRRGVSTHLLTTYPAFMAKKFLFSEFPITTIPWLEVTRRFYDKFNLGKKPDLSIAKAFGRFVSQNVPEGFDVLVGWSSATLEAISIAQDAGIKVVLERGSSHIEYQTDLLKDAYSEFKLNHTFTEPEIIAREKEEYDLVDAIAVPNQFAANSFKKFGLADKLIINPYGVDLSRFLPKKRHSKNKRKKIVFVGSVGIRKGVPWLLRAFKGLEDIAELHLLGPVERGFDNIIASENLEGIVIRGAIKFNNLINEFNTADIFCLPSLEEGFPLSMLQAMSSGLPVIVTPETGAQEFITPEKEGLIIPSKDPDRLREAFQYLISDPNVRGEMGVAARELVEKRYSWDDYADRAITAYQDIIK